MIEDEEGMLRGETLAAYAGRASAQGSMVEQLVARVMLDALADERL